jgi:hypothetical protein
MYTPLLRGFPGETIKKVCIIIFAGYCSNGTSKKSLRVTQIHNIGAWYVSAKHIPDWNNQSADLNR